jgi:hypothetical protein
VDFYKTCHKSTDFFIFVQGRMAAKPTERLSLDIDASDNMQSHEAMKRRREEEDEDEEEF